MDKFIKIINKDGTVQKPIPRYFFLDWTKKKRFGFVLMNLLKKKKQTFYFL